MAIGPAAGADSDVNMARLRVPPRVNGHPSLLGSGGGLILETFPNPHPSRDYLIEHHVHEFTSLCPKTGQPDFASLLIRYVADAACVELKSLKLHLQSYRDRGIFYEDVTNDILDRLVACCHPKWMLVQSTWSTRGGIHTVITAQHGHRPEGHRPADVPPPG